MSDWLSMSWFDPDMGLRKYVHERLSRHSKNTYRGVHIAKLPEDLWTYQTVIFDTKPDTVIEFGTHAGGSALWFRDQLRTVSDYPLVITVDQNKTPEPKRHDGIVYITGDLNAESTIREVHEACPPRRTMIVDDSGHSVRTTKGVLDAYHDLVTPGCYFVVEDGIVDTDLCLPSWGDRGVLPSIEEFVSNHPEFERQWLAPHGITMHPGGWLKRR